MRARLAVSNAADPASIAADLRNRLARVPGNQLARGDAWVQSGYGYIRSLGQGAGFEPNPHCNPKLVITDLLHRIIYCAITNSKW